MASCSSYEPPICGSPHEEADAFLNGRLGLDLTAEDVEGLVGKTEGWPAGLYLAALSLQSAADRHALRAARLAGRTATLWISW